MVKIARHRAIDHIKRQFGISFSDEHVWRLLGSMGFSSQKPERRAIERDETVVRIWKRKNWPGLKKSPPGAQSHRLHRRVGAERAADPGAYLGAQRRNPRPAVPFQLETESGLSSRVSWSGSKKGTKKFQQHFVCAVAQTGALW